MYESIKVCVFDFDGVIVADSEYIKEDSWEVIVKELGENTRQILIQSREKFKESKGSRYDILMHTLVQLNFPSEVIKEKVDELAELYNREVQVAILKRGVFESTRRVLETLSENYHLYVNSATPEHAVRESIDSLGIKQFFTGILGQPRSKENNLQKIIKNENILPSEVIFIGDGNGDYKASNQTGVHFIGLANSWNMWEDSKPFPIVKDLLEVIDIIQKDNT